MNYILNISRYLYYQTCNLHTKEMILRKQKHRNTNLMIKMMIFLVLFSSVFLRTKVTKYAGKKSKLKQLFASMLHLYLFLKIKFIDKSLIRLYRAVNRRVASRLHLLR